LGGWADPRGKRGPGGGRNISSASISLEDIHYALAPPSLQARSDRICTSVILGSQRKRCINLFCTTLREEHVSASGLNQSTLPTLLLSLSTSNLNSFLSPLNASVPSPPQPCFGGSQLWPLEFLLSAGETGGSPAAVRVEFRGEEGETPWAWMPMGDEGAKDCQDECLVTPKLPLGLW
jgi:hypothetical protein